MNLGTAYSICITFPQSCTVDVNPGLASLSAIEGLNTPNRCVKFAGRDMTVPLVPGTHGAADPFHRLPVSPVT